MHNNTLHVWARGGAMAGLLVSSACAHAGTVADLGAFRAEYEAPRNGLAMTWEGSKQVYSKYSYVNTVTASENKLGFAFVTNDPELTGTTPARSFTQLLVDLPIKLQSDRADPFVYKVDITVLVSSTTPGLIEASARTYGSSGQTILASPTPLSLSGATPLSAQTFTTYFASNHVFNELSTWVYADYKNQPGGSSNMQIVLDKLEISTVAVPEPGSCATMLLGLGALGGLAARRRLRG